MRRTTSSPPRRWSERVADEEIEQRIWWLTHGLPREREQAIRALGEIGPAALEPLCRAVERYALLARTPGGAAEAPPALAPLLARCQHRDPGVRRQAAVELGQTENAAS